MVRALKTILVVDDSTTIRRMVIATLQRVPNVVFEQAQSGLEAIEQLAMSSADLVLLDLNMPDIHGLEVLRFIRSHQTFKNIPVIVLTTRGDEESRAAALADGATLYLTKPFTPDVLVPEVQRLLGAA
jgi:two-component system, chemotaxis family, chemotaxis protein CheY